MNVKFIYLRKRFVASASCVIALMAACLLWLTGWAGDIMNYSFSSQAEASSSLPVSSAESDVNSETEENESGVKNLNTT